MNHAKLLKLLSKGMKVLAKKNGEYLKEWLLLIQFFFYVLVMFCKRRHFLYKKNFFLKQRESSERGNFSYSHLSYLLNRVL